MYDTNPKILNHSASIDDSCLSHLNERRSVILRTAVSTFAYNSATNTIITKLPSWFTNCQQLNLCIVPFDIRFPQARQLLCVRVSVCDHACVAFVVFVVVRCVYVQKCVTSCWLLTLTFGACIHTATNPRQRIDCAKRTAKNFAYEAQHILVYICTRWPAID
jgi:hypothetical protein